MRVKKPDEDVRTVLIQDGRKKTIRKYQVVKPPDMVSEHLKREDLDLDKDLTIGMEG